MIQSKEIKMEKSTDYKIDANFRKKRLFKDLEPIQYNYDINFMKND